MERLVCSYIWLNDVEKLYEFGKHVSISVCILYTLVSRFINRILILWNEVYEKACTKRHFKKLYFSWKFIITAIMYLSVHHLLNYIMHHIMWNYGSPYNLENRNNNKSKRQPTRSKRDYVGVRLYARSVISIPRSWMYLNLDYDGLVIKRLRNPWENFKK